MLRLSADFERLTRSIANDPNNLIPAHQHGDPPSLLLRNLGIN